jgi:hypothetical protein
MDPDKTTTVLAVPLTVSTPVAAASMVGPKIFQFHPLTGLPSERDHFYYNCAVDISCSNFETFIASAAH